MRRHLKTRRSAAALATGLILAMSMSACSTSGSGQSATEQKQEQKRLTESERSRLKTELATLEHVTNVDVGYNDVWPEKGSVSVSLVAPFEFKTQRLTDAYYEAAAKAVWLSKIKPLDRITVVVGFDNGDKPGSSSQITPLLGEQGISELTKRYGPRPV